MSRRRKKAHEAEMDFELNIASIIDCFTVLITYLLVSASFISLGILDVTVAATASESSAPPPEAPKLSVTIDLQPDHALQIKTEGEDNKIYPVPAKNGAWDFDTLNGYLAGFKQKYPTLEQAMVTANDTIEYKELVKTVEVTRKTLPKVSLGAEQ